MYIQIFLLIGIIFLVKADYYWKDYSGTIPHDAFIGGHELDGTPTYIGQTVFPAKQYIMPTILPKGERYGYLIAGSPPTKWFSDKHSKILCSNNHSLFRWIPTDTKKIHYLTGCKLIYGGGTENSLFTIGRANHQGRTLTGRIYDSPNLGLVIHDGGNKEYSTKEFEVLSYNCANPYIEEV